MENNILTYLVGANLVLIVLYLVYIVLFSSTTFHKSNRFVLLFTLIFAMLSPLVRENPLPPKLVIPEFDEWLMEGNITIQNLQQIESATQQSLISVPSLLLIFYVAGVLLFACRFIYQLAFLLRIRFRAKPLGVGKNILMIKSNALPFTFWRWIFIPENKYRSADLDLILKHEKVHASQLHTLDIIIAEIACILFWFNPLLFLLKSSLKTIHEYLADECSSAGNEVNYLRLLADGVAYAPVNGISSSFNWLTIKKRIKMITKNKTSNIKRLAYIVLAPLTLLVVQSFTIMSSTKDGFITKNEDTASIPSIMPLKPEGVKKTSGYGMRMHPTLKVEKMHKGVDFAAEEGTPVYATADGIVAKMEFEEEGKGYGRVVMIKHDEAYATLYSQLSAFKVTVGQKVKKGEVIGLVGSSGLSTGPHLHYEVHKNGERVNPEDYFE